jgi:hypothetical protein
MQRTPYNKDAVSNGEWPELAYRNGMRRNPLLPMQRTFIFLRGAPEH